MVKVRLRRAGRKGQPCYAVVATDSTVQRDGKFLEKIGTYQPMLSKDNPNRFLLKADRLSYWFGCGAHPTESVLKLLVRSGFDLPSKMREKWDAKVRCWSRMAAEKQNKATAATS